jgi:hypothetical protein
MQCQMSWRDLGLLIAVAVFMLECVPWGTLIRWAKEETEQPSRNVI